jgi:hypothetical protein
METNEQMREWMNEWMKMEITEYKTTNELHNKQKL